MLNCSIVRSYTLIHNNNLTATATGQRENCDQQDGKINLKALGGFLLILLTSEKEINPNLNLQT